MQIYQILKNEHKEIKSILAQMDETTERAAKTRPELLQKLKQILVPHSRAEEQAFYEPLKYSEIPEADSIAFESYEEHWVADQLMEELSKTDPADKRWGALCSVLKENLEHHIEEEENLAFKKAHLSFNDEEATAMAEIFLEMKKGYKEAVASGANVPQPPSHSIQV